MIPFKHRFHGHGSLRYVYKNGHAIRSKVVTLKYIDNPRRKHSRIAVVVSKKVHKSAVGRNRMRRRIYEIIRTELPAINGTHDMVFLIFSSEVLTMSHEELHRVITDLFRSSGLYK